MKDGEDFATTGTESYNLSGKEKKEHVILNIQEEKDEGIVLDEKITDNSYLTGNFFIDLYKKINLYFVKHSKIKIKDKATFFHLLSVMITSGIPVIKSLKALKMQMTKSLRLSLILDDLSSSIEAGASLSESLLKYPDVFNEQEVGMIQSGEASGQLSRTLENLAKDVEKVYDIKRKLKSAMMYPIVIFILLIGVVAAMMIYVIPSMKTLFAASGGELPMITRVVVAISDFVNDYKVFLAVGILFMVLFIMIFKRTSLGKFVFDKIKISMPIFGGLFKMAYLSRFSRSLSNLLDSNISIVRAIEITGNSVGNEVYKRRILLCMEDVKQGLPLAESLSASPLFPPMLVNMMEVGEKTAQLDKISDKIAKFYETEVDTTISGISKIIEPIVLIIIGLTVGIVVAAIMLPIIQFADIADTL